MALSYRIDKATFDKLVKDFQDEYTPSGEGYQLDVTGAEFASASKFEKERDKRRAAETKQREAEDALRELKDGDDRPHLIARHEKELKKANEGKEAAEKKFTDFRNGQEKDKVVNEMAAKLSKTAPKLLAPHIASRVGIDASDPENPKAVVLGQDGKPSGKSFDELSAEILANKDFAAIVTVSQATGGAASKPGVTGRSGFPSGAGTSPDQAGAPRNLAEMKPAELAAHMRNVRLERAQQQGQTTR